MKHVIPYEAPPDADRFYEVNSTELGEIIRKIRQSEELARQTEWAYDVWQCDINAATLAAEKQDAFGATVWVAQDEDGWYFATR